MSNLRSLLCLGCLLALNPAGLLRADAPPPQPVDGKITWVYDYAEGQRLARQSGRPLFVVFRCER